MAKRFGVRGCVLIAAATDMLGSILRVFAWSPSSGSFLWMLIGTIWIAVSVPFFFRCACCADCAGGSRVCVVVRLTWNTRQFASPGVGDLVSTTGACSSYERVCHGCVLSSRIVVACRSVCVSCDVGASSPCSRVHSRGTVDQQIKPELLWVSAFCDFRDVSSRAFAH